MKRILFTLLFLLSCFVHTKAQTSNIVVDTKADFSAYRHVDDGIIWELKDIVSDEHFTVVHLRFTLTNNKYGGFYFPDNIYISGSFGKLEAINLYINSKQHAFNTNWTYYSGNKGKGAPVAVVFPRIPAGVESISYVEPQFIEWANIPILDNEDTVEKSGWTEESLRNYWANKGCTPIEGIYYFTNTNNKDWWGNIKHTLAIVKEGYQYKLIYIRGSNPKVWHEGDVKAVFIATATKGLYKVTSWYMENRMLNEDFYISFNNGFMSIYENTSSTSAEFLKLFPAVDENDTNPSYPITSDNIQQSTNFTSGSGVFVDSNMIATNNHIITNASRIEVIVKSGSDVTTYNAKVVAFDKINDLALISIDDPAFTIGTIPYSLYAKSVDVGTSIYTMGYPMVNYMGEEVKITDGIISSKTGYDGDITTYQISAPIQPGNSGGPLFDKKGHLVGITNAGIFGSQNVGYAIKSSYLCNLIESAPIAINVPSDNVVEEYELTEQVRILSKYVVYIKAYK